MTREEFNSFWKALQSAYPFDFKEDWIRNEWARTFAKLPYAAAMRSIKTYAETPDFKREPPTPDYLAYLTRDCNGYPDLLYKAIKRLNKKENEK